MTAPVTAHMPAAEALVRLRNAHAFAVVRARDAEEAVAIAEALHAGGLQAIELTFTTPGIEQALCEVRARLGPGLLLGAGTITTPEQACAAADSGADFLVSPHLDPPLLEAMLATGLLATPGVLTPSEVAAARRAGADAVKLFPASTVGVAHLKALLGPFPGLQVVPTGGISVAKAPEWLAAGAVAVGLGSELLPKALRDARAWDEIGRNAARLLDQLPTEGRT
ncbi:bifunctional 4-hydroxy-2-oxoglutarate aldolase/2-dehydro-3-deoxy-phosphogluconate aldolase [Kribbella sp. NPDC050820]|uniref:bifunctional 4-hydroxy-2-oxoglutarate aldolase/2-dehydro-3-deoxy-phosphogluconate aldolase n=1 Tax=Kribbella sp. NPDC050820 TaxID=3155408 RepID=UPI0033EE438A